MPRTQHLPVAFIFALVALLARSLPAQDTAKAQGTAPPEHEVLRHTRGGAYFIARPLKQKHDDLVAQVRQLQAAVRHDRIEGSEAVAKLRKLKDELEELSREIESKKVLVLPVKVLRQTETVMLDPGAERLLVVTADNIRVVGWEGPHIKCELEKTILTTDETAAAEQFRGLNVVHKHGPVPGIVGKTPAERAAEEREFLDSPDGRKLNEKQRAARAKFLQEIADSYAIYETFQGQAIDTIEIVGLTHEQGNRQITVEAKSPGGGGSLGSDWQRHAALTIYVPASRAIALRGCQVGLDVKDIKSALIVTSADSHDRDYEGQFQISGVEGSVTLDNVPIHLIEKVNGNVNILSTTEMVNTGTTHHDGMRHSYTPPPRTTRLANIAGDLAVWFSRADLRVEDVRGAIDIRNEFGDTRLVLQKPLADRANRVLSSSGKVEVELSKAALGKLPLSILTSCGDVKTNLKQDAYPSIDFGTGNSRDGTHRDWRGFHTAPEGGPGASFEFFNRVGQVLDGSERSAGLDLISRAGNVVVMEKE